jgi:Ca-activated chloride channel family protein
VLVLSDGADMGSRIRPLAAAQRARSLGVPVHAIAFGTPGGIVAVRRTGGFVEHIRVPPDPGTLRRIAATTGGRFFRASSAEALKAVYAELGRRIGHTTKRREVTVAFAAGAVVLLLTGGGLSALLFRRLP